MSSSIKFVTDMQNRNRKSNNECIMIYRTLPKIGPPSKISPPPFLNEVVAKGAFLSKTMPTYLCCSMYCYVKQEVPKSSTERLANEGRHHLLLLHKQVHDTRGIAESQHVG